MPSTISLCKFTGTISLGLLTGVSYTLSTLALPSLLTLPSAKPAQHTLIQTTRLSTLHIRTLSTLSAASLFLAFWLSPPRVRHPYLLWTGLVAAGSGGLDFVMKKAGQIDAEDDGEVNGEMVERRTREWQGLEGVRTAVAGLGFVMAVVGVWGDGA